jgi:C1A family cysteine protease
MYTSGVLNDPGCLKQLNHAVAAVGYGVDETGKKYYIIRNSWGAAWGDRGYIKIAVTD